MRKSALLKDTTQEFKKSITRFLSILIMLTLGSFIFVGLSVTGPTMRRTILDYVETYQLQDLTVSSPFGLATEDRILLSKVPGIEILEYGYRADLLLQDSDIVVRAESTGRLPAYELVAGRLPDQTGEMALDAFMLEQGFALGDQLVFAADKVNGDYALTSYTFTVVGFVNSPEYLMPTDKGRAQVGDGEVDCFAVISGANFALENASLARLTFQDVAGLDTYSKIYRERMKVHADEVETALANRPTVRLKQYYRKGISELSEGQLAVIEGRIELQKAQRDLEDARQKLADGWTEYQDGKAKFQREMAKAKKELADGEQELLDAKLELDDGYAKLAEGEQKLKDGRAQYDDGEAELAAAKAKLDDGEKQLLAAQAQIDAGRATLATNTATYQAGLAQIDGALNALTDGIDLADRGLDALTDSDSATVPEASTFPTLEALIDNFATPIAASPALTALKAQVDSLQADLAATTSPTTPDDLASIQTNLLTAEKTLLAALKTGYTEQRTTLVSTTEPQLAAAAAQLDASQAQVDAEWTTLNAGKAKYEAGRKKLEDAWDELVRGYAELADAKAKLADGQAKYDQGVLDLADGQAKLAKEQAKGEKDLADAYQKLLDGEAEYEDGLQKFKDQLPEAEADLSEAQVDIRKASNQLARLKVPDYMIVDRYKDPGFFQYIENSESMDFLSLIFPVFFFLIALLVSLTTMTRMVDEQRMQIGTLKALSYSNWDVVQKYLAYGSLASLFGSLIGIVAGQKILMPVVFVAYSSNFLFTQPIPDLPPIYSVLAVVISLLCTGYVAFLTTHSSLKENVASLLRPKAPKSGNRILIERITPLWRRLSFHNKVTARNIFRYKKRMLMTILGVAGCAALIFLGFGIQDSIGSILGKQYGELFRYDSIVIYDDGAVADDVAAFQAKLNADSRIRRLEPARYEQGIAQVPGKLDQTLNVIVPADAQTFSEVNTLRNRLTQQPIVLDQGAVISEKLAILLGLSAGDSMEFKDNDGSLQLIKIAAVTENYTGHYLYLSADYYAEIFGKSFKPNAAFILLKDSSDASSQAFSRSLLDEDLVLMTASSSTASGTIKKLMAAMDVIVVVILLASSMLAIVVLYNLTNINVSERIRELSTVMVLGFYPREVTAYVYRETLLLTALGIGVGYGLGGFLHLFVVTSLAPTSVLLDPAVNFTTFIYAALFTFGFSLVVMLIMHRRLMRIDMVSALKAVE